MKIDNCDPSVSARQTEMEGPRLCAIGRFFYFFICSNVCVGERGATGGRGYVPGGAFFFFFCACVCVGGRGGGGGGGLGGQ